VALSKTPQKDAARRRQAEQRFTEAASAAGLEADLVSLLEAATKAIQAVRQTAGDPALELDPGSRTLLEQGGLSFLALEPGETTSIAETAAEMATLAANAGSVREAARRMQVTDGRVRQMLRGRTLFGLTDGDVWRVPWFQFAGARPVPGLDRVMAAMPGTIHPVAVLHFLSLPNPDLVVEGQPMSPLAWLRTGADPGPVAAIATDL
jgi:hypothetical protein